MTRVEARFDYLTEKQERVGLNRREAIELYCLKDSRSSDESVKECSKKDCSLYAFRLSRGKQDPVARDQAIKSECMGCQAYQPSLIINCDTCECPLYEFRGYIRQPKHGKTPSKMNPCNA